MFGLNATKLARVFVGAAAVLAMAVVVALMSTTPRSEPKSGLVSRFASPKTQGPLARPSGLSTDKDANKVTIEELGPVPSKLDSRYWLFFVDEQNGWFADDEELWRSTDGGRNWNLLVSSKDTIFGIFFSSLQVGWLERSSGIYRTEDGGLNWKKVLTPLEHPNGVIAGTHFVDEGRIGWLAGGLYKPVTLKKFLEESPASYLV